MLRLINPEKVLPNSYVVEPTGSNIPHFEPGMIAQITGQNAPGQDIRGRYRCGKPIGIIDDIRTKNDDTTAATGRITIWECGIEGETDMFESSDTYAIGAYLAVWDSKKTMLDLS